MRSGLWHDSRDKRCRRPFGAVPCGETVYLSVTLTEEWGGAELELRLWSTSEGEMILHSVTKNADTPCVMREFTLVAPDKPGLLWYHFIVRKEDRTCWYGAPSDGFGGEGVLYEGVPTDWQITVYAKDAKVPSWYTNGTMYQIFPDRFYRGDQSAQPPPLPAGGMYHPHWHDFPFYAKDPQTGNIAAYDFFGGTLDGIVDKLTYLQSLGISILYLNPIFASVSNHKYDTGDYKKVDEQFGGDEGLDRLRKAAAACGIRLILDGVFSHTGADSVYFQEAVNSQDSPYYSWYRFTNYPVEYDCWWGVTTLPNVNELDPAYREFIISGPDSVIKHWLRRGAAGWRLDVADELPGEFVQEMYKELKATDSEAVLIGEVWEDASRKESYGVLREYLWGKELDSVINYPFRSAVIDFLTGAKTATEAIRQLSSIAENYPRPYFYATMNVLGTHDVPRALTLLGEAPSEGSLTKLEQARYHLPAEQRAKGLARLKLAVLIQFTSPGVPCVYYGDEAGLEGHSDPQNRRTYPWDGVDMDLLEWYRSLSSLRKAEPVLRTGNWIALDAGDEVLAYGRRTEEGRDALGEIMRDAAMVVLVNPKGASVVCSVDVSSVCGGPMRDRMVEGPESELYVPDTSGYLKVELAPFSALVLAAGVPEIFAERGAGILLHPSSLAGPYGIGDLGPSAHAFIDWLAAAGQKLWQILPLNPVDATGSPYQSSSAFAGNFLLISPDDLRERGLVDDEELAAGLSTERVEYVSATLWKKRLLRIAFSRFQTKIPESAYRQFCDDAADWLEEYALFMALKEKHGEKAWTEWDKDAAKRRPQALRRWRRDLSEEMAYHRFVQYIFFEQWNRLHEHAVEKNIKIIGDLPIFVSHDSADVWSAPHLFALNKAGRPRTKAGVPPDYFSRTGRTLGKSALPLGSACPRKIRLVGTTNALVTSVGGCSAH